MDGGRTAGAVLAPMRVLLRKSDNKQAIGDCASRQGNAQARRRQAMANRRTAIRETRDETPRPGRRRPIDLDVLDQHLGYSARRLQIWIFQDFIRRLAEIDIRPAQYSVLVVIGANPGLSQADLAEALGIERARMVHLLDRLESRALIERQPSAVDRRSHALHLAREGQRLLKRAKALAAEHEAQLDALLGGRRQQLLDLLHLADLPSAV